MISRDERTPPAEVLADELDAIGGQNLHDADALFRASEALRFRSAADLIGPTLDAWDALSNDERGTIKEQAPHFVDWLNKLGAAADSTDAPPATTSSPVGGTTCYVERSEVRQIFLALFDFPPGVVLEKIDRLPIFTRADFITRPAATDSAGVSPAWDDVAEDDPDVVIAARAIAEHGIGRPWSDFLPTNAYDVDHGDLTEYGRAAVAALRAAHPARGPDSTSDAVATVTYTNYRGETSIRRIIPKSVRSGSTEWHPEPQWLLLAWDDDKKADREFALKDFGARGPDREAIARIIDPVTFGKYDVEAATERVAQNGRPWADVCYGTEIEEALSKADAIIALNAEAK